MDPILKSLDTKISFFEKSPKKSDIKTYYQARFEYSLIFILAYYWNRNLDAIPSEVREQVIKNIQRPSVGSIINTIRALDKDLELFGSKKISKALSRYPELRNDSIGHGYIFEDGTEADISAFKKLITDLEEANIPILQQRHDLILVQECNDELYTGIRFRCEENDYTHWSCPVSSASFKINSLYAKGKRGQYFRLSPFIHVIPDNQYLVFRSISEKLTGRAKFNYISQTGTIELEWPEFADLWVEQDGIRKRNTNGTIINNYTNNYKSYLDIGIKKKVLKFIIENKASVASTLWGHGGIGKTATIQSICDDLIRSEEKLFDYIIFLSAKDRKYNYYTGKIERIEDHVNSFENLVKRTNLILGNEPLSNTEPIEEFSGKMLLIIDDYETFSTIDKKNISDFISRLNINHHKLVITTRANFFIIGTDFQTNELSETDTRRFLEHIVATEFQNVASPYSVSDLTDQVVSAIHKITSGRPLFIYQFVFIAAQDGLESALNYDIKSEEQAIDFLYGRIYDCLSESAKNVFVAMGQLIPESDEELSNLVEKVRYVLNMEHKDDEFNNALEQLIKLKIIELTDGKFFKIYSKEILRIMLDYYHKRDDKFRYSLQNRIMEITRDKKLDTDESLLHFANSSWFSKEEDEVVETYRKLLNRPESPLEIKIKAILSLGQYLFVERGNKERAVGIFDDYYHIFSENSDFIKMYSSYAWSTSGMKQKSINILKEYYSRHQGLDINDSLDIFGNLLTNSSLYWLERRDDTKTAKKYGEISSEEYDRQWKEQIENFHEIVNKLGIPLWHHIRDQSNLETPQNTLQSAVSGLYHFVEVCIRLNKLNIARDICNHIIRNYDEYYKPQFQQRLNRIETYSQTRSSYH
ncbi:NACHT domain protein [compost metagenome]